MKLYTPFSTRLSGSAKETELRLRNIFQWKKKRPPIILLVLVLVIALSCGGLVACREPKTVNTEDQLDILLSTRDTWRALDETDWWGYAVTDLDQNGRLELISSETHGTGHYTTTRLWEVNEALDGLTACKIDESCGPVMGRTPAVPAYYDGKTGCYWYVLQDEVWDGAWRYYESLRTIALNRGQVEGRFLALRDTEIPGNGEVRTIYQNSQGKIITKGEYQRLTLEHLPGMDPMTARLVWIEFEPMDELDEETLRSLLRTSMEGFALTQGALRAEDPYHEVLELYYQALHLQQTNPAAWKEDQSLAANDLLVWDLVDPYWAYEPDADLLAGIGYARQDLDGDGTDELLIGWTQEDTWNMDQGYIFAVYTLTDYGPMIEFGGDSRCRYILCEDGTILTDRSSGATESSTIRFRLPEGQIEAIWNGWNERTQSICYVYSDDPEEIQLFDHPSTYPDSRWMNPEEAEARREAWISSGMKLEYTTFAEYGAQRP